jgi:hypothetical protein
VAFENPQHTVWPGRPIRYLVVSPLTRWSVKGSLLGVREEQMRNFFFMTLTILVCACGSRGPEGQAPGDCDDGKDNDMDGLYDCDDDGCDLDNVCVNLAREAELAKQKAAAAERERARKNAEKKAESKKASKLGPVFGLDGLMVQTAQNGADINWINAKTYCDNLNLMQHTDWRLPTSQEAVKIIESGQLRGEPSYVMWTSTEKGKKRAVIVGMSGAVNDLGINFDGECRARCVRGALTK